MYQVGDKVKILKSSPALCPDYQKYRGTIATVVGIPTEPDHVLLDIPGASGYSDTTSWRLCHLKLVSTLTIHI